MRTLITATSLCILAGLGSANAHPTGDGHHFRSGGFGYGFGFHAQRAPTYGYAPRYQAPQYQQPQYQQPQYQPIQPAYSSGYQSVPRQSVYGAQPLSYGPVAPAHLGFNRRSNRLDIPASEGYNYGYSGGPTFGRDRNRVINGVQIFGPPR